MQKTFFGWLISGPCALGSERPSCTHCNFISNLHAHTRFWDLQEVEGRTHEFSEKEIACEKHFFENAKRDSAGRFIVALPLKQPPSSLGESCSHVKTGFLNFEKKSIRIPDFRQLCMDFMTEYINLGHMRKLGNLDEATVALKMHVTTCHKTVC